MQKEINLTWHFNKPPQEVWEYLTDAELLEQWLMKSDFKPVLGHTFIFTSPGGMVHHCEVLEIKPFSRLVYSWQRKSSKDGDPFDSKVEWTLTPKDDGTELHLVHNGFRALEDLEQHDKGWAMLVGKLADRVNNTVK